MRTTIALLGAVLLSGGCGGDDLESFSEDFQDKFCEENAACASGGTDLGDLGDLIGDAIGDALDEACDAPLDAGNTTGDATDDCVFDADAADACINGVWECAYGFAVPPAACENVCSGSGTTDDDGMTDDDSNTDDSAA